MNLGLHFPQAIEFTIPIRKALMFETYSVPMIQATI